VSPVELKSAVAKAQTLLLKDAGVSAPPSAVAAAPYTVPATPASPVSSKAPPGPDEGRAGGPFDNADSVSEREIPEVRETADEITDESAERLVDPFAAIKARISGTSFPSQTSPVWQTATISTPAPATPVPVSVMAAPVTPVVSSIAPAALTAEPPVTPATSEMSDGSQPAGATALPFERLQESLVARFQPTNNMIATTLAQAFDWRHEGMAVKFSVDKAFVHNFLEQDHKLLVDAISALLGGQYALEITLDDSRIASAKPDSGEEGIPKQVEMIRQMFRGTIAGEG
jgi:hypothetical protein